MKRKTKNNKVEMYTDAPEEMDFDEANAKVINNLLPPPHLLVAKKRKHKKVTIDFPENDIDFFKNQAKRLGVPYQSMIRSVVSNYVLISKARTHKI